MPVLSWQCGASPQPDGSCPGGGSHSWLAGPGPAVQGNCPLVPGAQHSLGGLHVTPGGGDEAQRSRPQTQRPELNLLGCSGRGQASVPSLGLCHSFKPGPFLVLSGVRWALTASPLTQNVPPGPGVADGLRHKHQALQWEAPPAPALHSKSPFPLQGWGSCSPGCRASSQWPCSWFSSRLLLLLTTSGARKSRKCCLRALGLGPEQAGWPGNHGSCSRSGEKGLKTLGQVLSWCGGETEARGHRASW